MRLAGQVVSQSSSVMQSEKEQRALPSTLSRADKVCCPAGDTWPYFRPNFVNMEQYGTDHNAEEVASADLASV